MLKAHPELIVMLTHHDFTVENAYSIFEEAKESPVQFWGMKERGLPLPQMKELFSYMKSCGKTTVLEVVTYTEKESLDGAKIAAECACDILMGTTFFDSVNTFCQEHHIKYMPFVGTISGRPSVLTGTIEEILKEALTYSPKGIYGFDLLGYRYTGDVMALNQTFISQINLPVCLAGSVTSYEHLDSIKQWQPAFFTIGSAFFDKKFGDTFVEQIHNVYTYIQK